MIIEKENIPIVQYFSNSAEEIKDHGILEMLVEEKKKAGLEKNNIVLFVAETDEHRNDDLVTWADLRRSPFGQDYYIWLYPTVLHFGLLRKIKLRRTLRHELYHIKSGFLLRNTRTRFDLLREEKNAWKYANRWFW